MGKLMALTALALLVACAGERAEPPKAAADSAAAVPAIEDTQSPAPAVETPAADTVMARDTAQPM